MNRCCVYVLKCCVDPVFSITSDSTAFTVLVCVILLCCAMVFEGEDEVCGE